MSEQNGSTTPINGDSATPINGDDGTIVDDTNRTPAHTPAPAPASAEPKVETGTLNLNGRIIDVKTTTLPNGERTVIVKTPSRGGRRKQTQKQQQGGRRRAKKAKSMKKMTKRELIQMIKSMK